MTNWVYGTGPTNAKLMLVGEAPGKTEAEMGKPFVGLTGELVTEFLEKTGVKRSDVYITNVVKVRPPNNDLSKLHELGYTIDSFTPLLWEEIKAVRPNCILAMGALALETLTGMRGIRNYRGSILPCLNAPTKVVATIHPAALFQRGPSGSGMFTWKQRPHIQFDFFKAVKQSQFAGLDLPQRDLRVIRTATDFEYFLKPYKGKDHVYCDTEVYKALLVCIGFAFTPHEGISIPLLDLKTANNPRGIPFHELLELWKAVDKFLRSGIRVTGQNFKADKVYWLEEAGFRIANFFSDTMFKMHTIQPEFPKSLAFQASILTDEPFWKSEGKEYNPHKDRIDTLCLYNAKDCAVNAEVDLAMDEDLEEFGLTDFFYNFVMKAYPAYEHMEKRGLLVSLEKHTRLQEDYKEHFVIRNRELEELVGHPVNVYSSKQIPKLLYEELRLPRRQSTNDDILVGFISRLKDQRKIRILQLIREIRTVRKMTSTYLNARPDWDGRMRTSYNQVGTETGRTSTSIIEKPLRTGKWGVPFQTVPKHGEFGADIRKMYVPDPGKVFLEFDQSQAEARVVAVLAEDWKLLELFDKTDVHKLTATYIYDTDPDHLEIIDKEMRQVGKAARHGLAYDEQPPMLALKTGISIYRAKKAFEGVHKMSPNIVDVFHEGVQQALAENSKVFWTPFGRRREFLEKWGRDLFKEAYAHIPQSTVGDNTKRCMIAIWEQARDWIDIMIELHDGLVVQVDQGREEECYDFVKPRFEQPIDFNNCTLKRDFQLIIPIECKRSYSSWGDLEDWR